MAGDWIKMRVDLMDDPAVISMAATLSLDEDTIVGKLHRIWSWADKHTIDGTTNGVNEAWLDRFVACKGFGEAMRSASWLEITGGFLKFPHFDRHNGTSAKSRAEATLRKRLSRKNRDEGATGLQRVVTPAPFIRAVIARDGGICAYCGDTGGHRNKLGADHIIPITRGGKDAIENLVSCCRECNNEKNDRTPDEWGTLPSFLPEGVTFVSQQICDNRVTREEKRREDIKPKSSRSPSGSRLQIESLPESWAYYASKERPDIDAKRVFQDFRDYWIAIPGSKGSKLDWTATWRKWVRNQGGNGKGNGNGKFHAVQYTARQLAKALDGGTPQETELDVHGEIQPVLSRPRNGG